MANNVTMVNKLYATKVDKYTFSEALVAFKKSNAFVALFGNTNPKDVDEESLIRFFAHAHTMKGMQVLTAYGKEAFEDKNGKFHEEKQPTYTSVFGKWTQKQLALAIAIAKDELAKNLPVGC